MVDAGSQRVETVASVGATSPASSGAGAAVATFPRFVAKDSADSASVPSNHMPGVAGTEIEQCCGRTPFVLPSVDAMELHGMLGAAIQVYPVPEDQATEFQRSDPCWF